MWGFPLACLPLPAGWSVIFCSALLCSADGSLPLQISSGVYIWAPPDLHADTLKRQHVSKWCVWYSNPLVRDRLILIPSCEFKVETYFPTSYVCTPHAMLLLTRSSCWRPSFSALQRNDGGYQALCRHHVPELWRESVTWPDEIMIWPILYLLKLGSQICL